MTRTRSRALAAVALLAGLLAPAAPVTAQSVPADVVLPAVLPATPPRLDEVAASREAVAFTRIDDLLGGGEATTVLTPDGGDRRVVGRPLGLRPLAGTQLLLATRDQRVSVLDVRTGASRVLPTSPDRHPALLPDGGWVEVAPAAGGFALVRRTADDAVAARVPLGTDTPLAVVADADAVAVRSVVDPEAAFADAVTTWRIVEREQVRVLGTSRGPVAGPALTRGAVAWADATAVVRVPLAGGVAVRRAVRGDGVAQLAVTPTATAWLETEGIDVRLVLSPEGEPARRVDPDVPVQRTGTVLTATPDEVVVAAGATSATRGLYALAPDGGSRLVAAAGGAAPPMTALRLGALVTAELEGVVGEPRARAVERTVDRRADGSTSVGPPRVVLTQVGLDVVTGTGLVAGTRAGLGFDEALLADGAGTAAQRPVPGASGTLRAVSGPRVVRDEVVLGPDAVPRPVAHVRDVRWEGGALTLPGSGHLEGDLLARVLADGTVLLRDLGTGDEVVLRAAGGAPAPGGLGRPVSVQVADGWVAWRVGTERAVVPVADRAAVRRLPDGERDAALAGGRVAWADEASGQVHLLDLADGSDQVLGRQADPRVQPSATTVLGPDAVAWTQDDGSTRVRALPLRDGPVRVLATWAPRRVSPASGLVVRVAVDRPATARLTVTDAAGATLAVVPGSTADGGLRLAWDLRRVDGSRVADGRYAWRVDGVGPDPLTGEAVLDSVAPDLVTGISPLASDVGTGPGQRVTWRSTDSTARFVLTGEQRARVFGSAADAPFVWTGGGRLAADAPSGGTGFGPGTGRPAWGEGSTFRYTVEVRDEAGNSRSTTAVQLTPYDDRWRALRWSAGWTRGTASEHWLGTHTEATTPGRTVTVRETTNRVVVVGTRCGTCGRFELRVDGRLLRTVDTRGAALAPRQRLVDLDLGGIPRPRTITLTTLATSGRPRVRLDAVALLR